MLLREDFPFFQEIQSINKEIERIQKIGSVNSEEKKEQLLKLQYKKTYYQTKLAKKLSKKGFIKESIKFLLNTIQICEKYRNNPLYKKEFNFILAKALTRLAKLEANIGKIKKAKKHLNLAIQVADYILNEEEYNPTFLARKAKAMDRLGKLEYETGNIKNAEKLYKQALEHINSAINLTNFYFKNHKFYNIKAKILLDYAQLLMEHGHNEKAKRFLKESINSCEIALRKKRNFEKAIINKSRALTRLAKLYSRLGNQEKAINLLNDAIEESQLLAKNINKNNEKAYLSMGKAYARFAKIKYNFNEEENTIVLLKKAIANLTKTIQLTPCKAKAFNDRAKALTRWAKIEINKKNYRKAEILLTKALKDYNRAISINPQYARAYSNKIITLRRLFKVKTKLYGLKKEYLIYLIEGIKAGKKSISINKNHAKAYNNISVVYRELASFYLKFKNFKKAEYYIKKSVDYLRYATSKVDKFMAKAFYNKGKSLELYIKILKKSGNNIDPNLYNEMYLSYKKAHKINPKYIKPYKALFSLEEKIDNSLLDNFSKIIDSNLKSLSPTENYRAQKEFIYPYVLGNFEYYLKQRDNKEKIIINIEKYKSYIFIKEFFLDIPNNDGDIEELQKERNDKLLKLQTIRRKLYRTSPSTIENQLGTEIDVINKLLNFLPEQSSKEKKQEQELKKQEEELKEEINHITNEILKKLNIDIKTDLDTLSNALKESELVIYPTFYDNEIKTALFYKINGKPQVDIQTKKTQIDINEYAKLSFVLNSVLLIAGNEGLIEKISNLPKDLLERLKNTVEQSKLKQETKDEFKKYIQLIENTREKEISNLRNIELLKLLLQLTKAYKSIREKMFKDVEEELQNFVEIPEHITEITISPIGELNRIPIHAVFTDNYKINYIPTLKIRTIPTVKKEDNKNKKALLISANESHFLEETQKIQELLESKGYEVERLINPDKQTVIQKLQQPLEIVHFAVHGVYDYEENKLLLGQGDELSFSDIVNLKFDIDFISMSSCETNTQSEIKGIDELNALERAFLTRGARRVITTFYSVFSNSAKDFSEKLYTEYTNSSDFKEAYQKASKYLKNKKDLEYMFFRYADIN